MLRRIPRSRLENRKDGDEDGSGSCLQDVSRRERPRSDIRVRGQDVLLLCTGLQSRVRSGTGEVPGAREQAAAPLATESVREALDRTALLGRQALGFRLPLTTGTVCSSTRLIREAAPQRTVASAAASAGDRCEDDRHRNEEGEAPFRKTRPSERAGVRGDRVRRDCEREGTHVRPAIKDGLVNAGADWVVEEVVVDGNLIASRTPWDLPAFMKEVTRALE